MNRKQALQTALTALATMEDITRRTPIRVTNRDDQYKYETVMIMNDRNIADTVEAQRVLLRWLRELYPEIKLFPEQ